MGYLTEESLYHILVEWCGLDNVERQSKLGKLRVDFKIKTPNKRVVYVEFDGHKHFTDANQIDRDNEKNSKLKNLVRIPYFIQLNQSTWNWFFNEANLGLIDSKFPHGFISKNLTLPASFCIDGVARYFKILNDLREYDMSNVADEIITSVINYKSRGRKYIYDIADHDELVLYDANKLKVHDTVYKLTDRINPIVFNRCLSDLDEPVITRVANAFVVNTPRWYDCGMLSYLSSVGYEGLGTVIEELNQNPQIRYAAIALSIAVDIKEF